MHVLIIPSEEFVPSYNKLDGIFQYHQALILKEAGYRMGALSVRLSFSVPMIVKGIGYKVLGKKAGNAGDNMSLLSLMKLGFTKLFKPKKFVTTENIDGIKVYRVDGLYRRKPANNKNHHSWIKAGMVCFEAYLKEEGIPALIHAHDAIYAGMLAEKINEKHGVKYIITEHSSTYALNKADDEILARVKKAHSKAAGLFAVSDAFASLLNNLFSFKRFKCLPNVLDQYLEQRAKANSLSVATSDRFVFLHIAVFKPVKDQETLLKAFQIVAQQKKNAELWIGGTGELEETLKQMVNDLNIQNNVKFLGLLNRDEVIQTLKQCNCFVLSSKYETFGVVTIEAMLFGKPVIVTKCGVGQDIVNKSNGFVVEIGNAPQLAEAMLKMMEVSSSYDSAAIKDFAIENFGKESFLKKITTAYKEAV